MPLSPSRSYPSIPFLIKSCKTTPHLHQFHAHIIHKGLEQDHFIICHFLSISTSVSYSTSIFNRLLDPSTFLYNILLKIFCKNSQFIDTFSLFCRMKQSEYGLPDKYSYPMLIKACSSELRLKEGEIVHGSAIRCGVSDDVYVGSSLISFYVMIDGYAKAGDMASARALFDEAPEKDVIAWSALISGYSRNEQPNEAVKIFFEMVSMNFKPDEFIMVSLMSACSQLGNSELAKWVDSYLSQTSIEIRQAHLIFLASLLFDIMCNNVRSLSRVHILDLPVQLTVLIGEGANDLLPELPHENFTVHGNTSRIKLQVTSLLSQHSLLSTMDTQYSVAWRSELNFLKTVLEFCSVQV
ncbi:hypothetical protein SADUNF_Sadunf06G0162700 [Salix dunnii]|uniref:Pentatricopeptide repeat-containing protein n=1 Tax=Salix dunnii TaxID=1413687 RepID=A0A835K0I3_9ROSI|nr:hypothetical protein SADUNF_Sadunf06G0162700 [Salix dunnii]